MIVGLSADEWYPVYEPQHRKEEVAKAVKWEFRPAFRSLYKVPWWVWLPYRLLLPIFRKLLTELQEHIQYMDTEHYRNGAWEIDVEPSQRLVFTRFGYKELPERNRQ